MKAHKSRIKILKILLKDSTVKPTITSLAKEVGISRVGAWKVIMGLGTEKLVKASVAGTGKTSVILVSLNWDNPLIEKTLSVALTEDAIKNQRWINNFAELGDKVAFLIIYGSIIHSPKEANDIDILSVTNKSKFLEIEEAIKKIQKTQLKKMHILNFTQAELKQELEKPNRVFIDAIKKGIVLFGQEKFIKFIKNLDRK